MQLGRFVYNPQRLLRSSLPQHRRMLIGGTADRQQLESAESRRNSAVS
jgi:hypothetical protein